MKTPEEIKKGLAFVTRDCIKCYSCVDECPYNDDCIPMDNTLNADVPQAMLRDAIEYIEQLEDQLREITKKIPQWISVYTQMPKDDQHVLAVNGDGVMEVLYYDKEWPNVFCRCGGLLKVCNITHWMPLPEAPKEVQHERL